MTAFLNAEAICSYTLAAIIGPVFVLRLMQISAINSCFCVTNFQDGFGLFFLE